jgi:hypothetical protein
MKYLKTAVGFLVLACLLAACGEKLQTQAPTAPTYKDITKLVLADDEITENGTPVSTDSTAAVYTARDIVYYEAGKDFTYGEGSEKDAHTPEEAAAHTVLHITQPGAYSLSGKLSLGQIARQLGYSERHTARLIRRRYGDSLGAIRKKLENASKS